MKTCLYNFAPLKPHFYKVKLGFTGVYIIFLISAKNIDYGYSLELPHWGGCNKYPQSMFWAEIWKMSEFFIWKFYFFGCKIFNIFLNRHVCVMRLYGFSLMAYTPQTLFLILQAASEEQTSRLTSGQEMFYLKKIVDRWNKLKVGKIKDDSLREFWFE